MNKYLWTRLIQAYAVILILMLGLYVIYTAANITDRHSLVQGKTYVAKYVYLPGYNTIYELEQHMSMAEWTGTKLESLSITKTNGEPVPEASAAVALLTTGAFPGYSVKHITGEHYELYKPGKETKYFTMEAPYRIGPLHLVKDLQ